MSDIYENMRDGMIANVLAKYGQAVILSIMSDSVYDPASGTTTVGEKLDFDSFGLETEYEIKDIDGSVIQQGDKKLILLAMDGLPEPNPNYTLYASCKVWKIISCNPIAPAGVAVVYELQVRK